MIRTIRSGRCGNAPPWFTAYAVALAHPLIPSWQSPAGRHLYARHMQLPPTTPATAAVRRVVFAYSTANQTYDWARSGLIAVVIARAQQRVLNAGRTCCFGGNSATAEGAGYLTLFQPNRSICLKQLGQACALFSRQLFTDVHLPVNAALASCVQAVREQLGRHGGGAE